MHGMIAAETHNPRLQYQWSTLARSMRACAHPRTPHPRIMISRDAEPVGTVCAIVLNWKRGGQSGEEQSRCGRADDGVSADEAKAEKG